MSIESAKDFFDWLTPELGRVFDSADVQHDITSKLKKVCDLVRWEAGPWPGGGSFFAISPNMNIDLVPVARDITSFAPTVPGWTFLSAKPRKLWNRKGWFRTMDGSKEPFDLSNWRYYLTSINDGEFFDVNFVPGGVAVSESRLPELGEMLAASELGEDVFLSHVGRVNIVPDRENNPTSEIDSLYPQFMELLEGRNRH
jgi:hypothetical protein